MLKHIQRDMDAIQDGYICGWISREKELSEMGCSYFEERKENEQLSLF